MKLNIELPLINQAVSGKLVKIILLYMYMVSGEGTDNLLGSKNYIKINLFFCH